MREAIRQVTDKPVALVINTHHHPDHFLGNQAFADGPIAALADVQKGIASDGNAFAENLFRMSGDWMKGTEVVVPTRVLQAGPLTVAGRPLRLLALDGHTAADLAVLDETSHVLFAGDLVFNDRAPTTPHAQIPRWLGALDSLERLMADAGVKMLVPGHGAVTQDAAPIARTRAWLRWLSKLSRKVPPRVWICPSCLPCRCRSASAPCPWPVRSTGARWCIFSPVSRRKPLVTPIESAVRRFSWDRVVPVIG